MQSVLFHAFNNEGPSNDPTACAGYNVSASTIRQLVGNPPSRLVTWASDKRTSDVCLDIADVISFNNVRCTDSMCVSVLSTVDQADDVDGVVVTLVSWLSVSLLVR